MTEQQEPAKKKAPAGWYDDAKLENTRRYWDGEAWTDRRQEKLPPAVGAPMTEVIRRSFGAFFLCLVVAAISIPLATQDGSVANLFGVLGAAGSVVSGLTLFVAIGTALIRGPEVRRKDPKVSRVVGAVLLIAGVILTATSLAVAALGDVDSGSSLYTIGVVGAVMVLYLGLPLTLWALVHSKKDRPVIVTG